jgi:NAD(P)H-flavin reductase
MPLLPRQYTAPVLVKQTLSPHVFLLQLKTPSNLTFSPGQFASWLIGPHRRPLSFASVPTSATLDFIIGTAAGGICSQYVKNLQPGDTVNFLAPYGRFTLDTAPRRPSLFIATGTGLAPIRAQLQHLLHANSQSPTTLIYGNHNEDHLLLHHELTQLTQQHSRFTYHPTLSNPSPRWTGHTHLVTHLTPQLVSNLPDRSIYICGNPQMVTDMKTVLTKHHVPSDQIFTEQYF